MDYELPGEFDLIVVGTGMVESIVSAAASRIGKTVLHIDSNGYYGGLWASFNLDAFQKLDRAGDQAQIVDNTLISEGEHGLPIGNNSFGLKNFSCKWHIPEKKECGPEKEGEVANNKETEEEEKKDESKENKSDWTQEDLFKDSRKFNIDVSPKLHFARGDFVELLISSNIARYSEFKSVSRVLTWLNNQLEVVPCSRSDVFANNRVSVIEKRMLMKLLTSLDSVEKELEGTENKSFKQYLKEKKLTPNLIHYVLYAISMSTEDVSCSQGIARTKRFMNSLGRFGKTPFLFSMYGSGEVPQQFCRLSAVFGGVYALSYPMSGFIFDNENRFDSLVCKQQRIKAKQIVMGIEKAPESLVTSVFKKYISRAIFITDRSIMESEKEHLTLLLYPPEDDRNLIVALELGTLTGTCPKDTYLVHMITEQKIGPKEDLKQCVEHLFGCYEDRDVSDNSKPRVLWSCFFSIPDTSESDLESNIPNNVLLCPGPDIDLDYDKAIEKARHIFAKIYPETEFLPRAPDPEEIVIGDDSEEKSDEFANEKETEDLSSNSDTEDVKNDESTKSECKVSERGDEELKEVSTKSEEAGPVEVEE